MPKKNSNEFTKMLKAKSKKFSDEFDEKINLLERNLEIGLQETLVEVRKVIDRLEILHEQYCRRFDKFKKLMEKSKRRQKTS
jgi:hypothetical protein